MKLIIANKIPYDQFTKLFNISKEGLRKRIYRKFLEREYPMAIEVDAKDRYLGHCNLSYYLKEYNNIELFHWKIGPISVAQLKIMQFKGKL